MSEKREIETKFEVGNLKDVSQRLAASGYGFGPVYHGEETVIFFDNQNGDLRASGGLLRLKITKIQRRKDKIQLTFKGDERTDGQFKNLEELEVDISNAEEMIKILHLIGFSDVFTYKKKRGHWHALINGGESIELDELENGRCFVEIEASPERIKFLAKALRLSWKRATTKGYIEILKEDSE